MFLHKFSKGKKIFGPKNKFGFICHSKSAKSLTVHSETAVVIPPYTMRQSKMAFFYQNKSPEEYLSRIQTINVKF